MTSRTNISDESIDEIMGQVRILNGEFRKQAAIRLFFCTLGVVIPLIVIYFSLRDQTPPSKDLVENIIEAPKGFLEFAIPIVCGLLCLMCIKIGFDSLVEFIKGMPSPGKSTQDDIMTYWIRGIITGMNVDHYCHLLKCARMEVGSFEDFKNYYRGLGADIKKRVFETNGFDQKAPHGFMINPIDRQLVSKEGAIEIYNVELQLAIQPAYDPRHESKPDPSKFLSVNTVIKLTIAELEGKWFVASPFWEENEMVQTK